MLQSRRDEMPERAVAALDLLVADVARFQSLVEDLLEISRFDAGAVRLVREDLLVAEFVRQAISVSSVRDAPVKVSEKAELLVIRADKRRLARVIANLVDNARIHGGGQVDGEDRRSTFGEERGQRAAGRLRAGGLRLDLGRRPRPRRACPRSASSCSSASRAAAAPAGAAAWRVPASAWPWSTSTSGCTAGGCGWRTGRRRSRAPASSSSYRRRKHEPARLLRLVAARSSACSLLAAACGIPNDSQPRDVDRGRAASSWSTRRRRRRRRRRSGPKVYFLSQAPNGQDRLQPAGRNVSGTPTAVLTELFNGLTQDEQQSRRWRTAIPADTKLMSAMQEPDGTLVIDLNQPFFQATGETQIKAVAQIVFTATGIDGVKRVQDPGRGSAPGLAAGRRHRPACRRAAHAVRLPRAQPDEPARLPAGTVADDIDVDIDVNDDVLRVGPGRA